MKHLFFLAAVLFSLQSEAQVLKRLGDRAKQKMEQKAGQKVDKSIDESLDGTRNKPSEEATENSTSNSNAEEKQPETLIKPQGQSLKAYSKFDFVPGDVILYAEDFSQDVVGEFPAKWNTNGSGNIVTLDGIAGKWLELIEDTRYETPYKNKLPDNFTVEYDIITEFKDDQNVPDIKTILYREPEKNRFTGAFFALYPNGGNSQVRDATGFHNQNGQGYTDLTAKYQYISTFNNFNHKATPVHIALWVQKERVRAWVNQEKVYDLPKGMPAEALPERLAFELSGYGGPKENYKFYLSNIKIAAASPDTRNKLITEGKWSTSGILFDVNSDKIKPASYGVLKEIAGVLNEHPSVKVKIIGHTDTDGDDAANLDLSKRRAASVKTALASEFSIDASRMETDGLGETKPVSDNGNAEGKAQNRRVEFVKM